MDWGAELISLFLFICKHYQNNLSFYCQRMTNHADLKFSEKEAITLYLYGVIEGFSTIKGHSWVFRYIQPKLAMKNKIVILALNVSTSDNHLR